MVYFLHGYIREEGAGVFDPISRQRSASKAIEGKGAIGNQYIPHIRALATSLDAIIIFVNGGSCYYRNSVDPDGPRYEDHIIEELLPFVEEQFNAIPSRDGRAITGHSMGAMGAAYLGLKYSMSASPGVDEPE